MITEDYYKVERISNSFLGRVKNDMLGLPNEFKAKQETLDFGKQLHESILEPHKYIINLKDNESYLVNAHKIDAMTRAALSNPLLSLMLKSPKVLIEHDLYFNEPRYDLPCKCKIDIWLRNRIGDIKTTDAKTKKEFEVRVKKYRYNRQGAFYLDPTGAEEFIIFGISKHAPYPCFTYVDKKNSDRINEGRKEYEDLIDYFISNREKYNSFLK